MSVRLEPDSSGEARPWEQDSDWQARRQRLIGQLVESLKIAGAALGDAALVEDLTGGSDDERQSLRSMQQNVYGILRAWGGP